MDSHAIIVLAIGKITDCLFLMQLLITWEYTSLIHTKYRPWSLQHANSLINNIPNNIVLNLFDRTSTGRLYMHECKHIIYNKSNSTHKHPQSPQYIQLYWGFSLLGVESLTPKNHGAQNPLSSSKNTAVTDRFPHKYENTSHSSHISVVGDITLSANVVKRGTNTTYVNRLIMYTTIPNFFHL